MAKRVEITEEELSRLHTQLNTLKTEKFDLMDANRRLTEKMETLDKELQQYSERIVEMQVQRQRQEAEGGGGKTKKSTLNRLVHIVKDGKEVEHEVELERNALRAQLESRDAVYEALQLNLSHLQNSNREAQMGVERLTKENTELRETIDTLQGYKHKVLQDSPDADIMKELEEAREELRRTREANKELSTTKKALEEMTSRCTTAESRLAEKEKALQELASLNEKNTDLAKNLHQRELDGKNGRIKALQLEISDLTKKLEVETEAKERLKSEVSKRQEDLEKKGSECKAWSEQCNHLNSLLESSGESKRSLMALQAALEKSKEREADLQTEVEKAEEARAAAEGKAKDLAKQLTRISEQLAQHLHTNEELETLRGKIGTITNHNESLKQAVKMRDDEIEKLKEEAVVLSKKLKQVHELQSRVNTLESELSGAQATAKGAFVNSLVYNLVESASWIAEHNRAEEVPRMAQALQDAHSECAKLRNAVNALEQRISDMEGEHNIKSRKQDNLIKELQSQLRAKDRVAVTPGRGTPGRATPTEPTDSPCVRSPSSSIMEKQLSCSSMRIPNIDMGSPLTQHGNGHIPPAVLEQENNSLIQRLADSQETCWRLEEEKRRLTHTVVQLQEDNDKKNNIIAHYISGLTAAKMAKRVGDKILDAPKSGSSGWFRGGTSSHLSEAKDMAQHLLQDALAENIQLSQQLERARNALNEAGVPLPDEGQ